MRDADDQRREHERRDDHLDQAQEEIGDEADIAGNYLVGLRIGPDYVAEIPDEDAENHADENVGRQSGSHMRPADGSASLRPANRMRAIRGEAKLSSGCCHAAVTRSPLALAENLQLVDIPRCRDGQGKEHCHAEPAMAARLDAGDRQHGNAMRICPDLEGEIACGTFWRTIAAQYRPPRGASYQAQHPPRRPAPQPRASAHCRTLRRKALALPARKLMMRF